MRILVAMDIDYEGIDGDDDKAIKELLEILPDGHGEITIKVYDIYREMNLADNWDESGS